MKSIAFQSTRQIPGSSSHLPTFSAGGANLKHEGPSVMAGTRAINGLVPAAVLF
jgi:hypothetical protein